MKRLLFKRTAVSKSQPVKPVFLHEYYSRGPKCHDPDACTVFDYKTTLSVLFDGETQRRFSSVRIVLYCDAAHMSALSAWGPIRQSGAAVTRSSTQHTPPKDLALPQLTVAFKVFPKGRVIRYYYLVNKTSPRSRDRKSVHVLLESEHSITPNTLHLSVDLEHSVRLLTLSKQPCESDCFHDTESLAYAGIRTVRVVPSDDVRPRTTIRCFPTELLLRVFEATDRCQWQRDLLSFAQVCRQWTCSMEVLFARLESSKWRNHCNYLATQSLEPCAFAEALSNTPFLGRGLQHLELDQHNGSYRCRNHYSQKASPGFNPALVAILRSTKHLQHLQLAQGYSSKADSLFSALPKLDELHTLSITRTGCRFQTMPRKKYWKYSVSAAQLARYMARWPSLSSLKVEHLQPGSIGFRRLFLRSPACALTRLCIRNSYISDDDLLYLTASSASTLTQVTLDAVSGITRDGLHVFLDSISRNVASLTVWNVECLPRSKEDNSEYALDTTVQNMWRLQTLSIRGDVASQRMLWRRSKSYSRSCSSDGDAGLPVIRLSFQVVPEIKVHMGEEWPGWQVVENC